MGRFFGEEDSDERGILKGMFRSVSLSLLALLLFLAGSAHAFAASFSVSLTKSGESVLVQASGVPDSAILLYYTDDNGDERHTTVGTADFDGYLSKTVNGGDYGIASGASVRIVADATGASVTKTWPYFGSTDLALPSDTLRVPVGEHGSLAITNPLNASLYVEGNTDPSAASAAISGGSLEVTGQDDGETTVTVCTTDGSDCVDLDVIVGTGGSGSASSGLAFSAPAPLIPAGTSLTVYINGPTAAYYIQNDSAPTVVQANAYTSTVSLRALKKGTANVKVCSPSGACGTIAVTVLDAGDDTALVLSKSAISVAVGSSGSVRVSGQGGYALDMKNERIASAEMTDNATATVEGLAEGKTTLEVCDRDDNCDTVSVTVTARTIAPPPSPSPSNVFTFSSYLSPGSSGLEVTALQQVLKVLGYFTVSPNGYFGPATEAAVKAFQKAKGISQLGVVGPQTRAALNGLSGGGASASSSSASSAATYHFTQFLSAGMSGAEVTALQQRLTALGVYTGPVTGYFGTLTAAAVAALQKAHGVAAVGYVGPATRALLN